MIVLLPMSFSAALAQPRFDPPPGWLDGPISVGVESDAADVELRYSTGVGEPSLAYSGPIDVEGTTILRVCEVDLDGNCGPVLTGTWLSMDDVLSDPVLDSAVVDDATYGPIVEDTLFALPILAITAPDGVSTDEQAVSFEFLDPGADPVQINCGAARVGGHSISYEKNNIRLYFRSEYGEGRLKADLFDTVETTGVAPIDSHDSLDLRGGSHDSVFYLGARGQYLRNMWMDETELEMGHLAPHGRFAHLFLNGEYTGLYHLRERFDAAFLAAHLGGGEDDYEAVNGGRATDGSGAAFAQVTGAASDFETFREWVDVDQFLDYMVLNFYAANDWDWNPYQNWNGAGPLDANQRWVFHSSDNDICLYYPVDENILDEPGPSYLFSGLLAEAHPDFMMALADRLHANLRGDGALTSERTVGRYARLASLAEDAVVAESARWGQGWWDRDDEWVTERDELLSNWLVVRGDVLLDQVFEAGWLTLPGPEFSDPPGLFGEGAVLRIQVPDGVDAELWVSRAGSDPRLPGGDLSSQATGPDAVQDVRLDRSAEVWARLRQDGVWGPLERGVFEVDASPSVVLNEWNAVGTGELLKSDGEDSAFGQLEGNGGDWIELLVLEDGLDLRGWSIRMTDLGGASGQIALSEHLVLSDLRAGTLFTIAEDLPESLDLDPDGGDWRFHLRAAPEGAVAVSDGFDVNHVGWQLTLWDADGRLRFGPAGEGVAPERGISSREVGLLAGQPGPDLRRQSDLYAGGVWSTFGAPNRWDDGEQDLSALREGEVDSNTPDSGSPGDGGGDLGDGGSDAGPDPVGAAPADGGCGCNGGGGAWGGLFLVLAALLRRRRVVWLALGLVACGGAKTGAIDDRDSGPVGVADDGGDGGGEDTAADCFEDADGDGFGVGPAVVPCGAGGAAVDGDCDDTDPTISPGAPERCDGVDDDCDGLVDDADDGLVDGVPFYVDGDGDGYGGERVVEVCLLVDGLAVSGGDCDDADPDISPGAQEICDDVDQDCDGNVDDSLGRSSDCPALSCLDVLDHEPEAADGAYWVTLPSGTDASLWCDMTTDGGGWTVGFLRNSVSTGSQPDFGSGDVSVADLAVGPADASGATASAVMAWHDLDAFDYSELQLSAWMGGSETYRSESIPRSHLRIRFADDGYLLYGGESPYYWCGGAASFTDGGVGGTDTPAGAPSGCRGHGSLGSGWDFSESTGANAGLTLCGGDGSSFLAGTWGGSWTYYGTAGAAQVIWVR